MRKRLAGVPPRERVAPASAKGIYTPEMAADVRGGLRLAEEMLAAGWPVIVDGSFSTSQSARRRARRPTPGVPFTVLWCDAPDEVLGAATSAARGPHEVSDGRGELLARTGPDTSRRPR